MDRAYELEAVSPHALEALTLLTRLTALVINRYPGQVREREASSIFFVQFCKEKTSEKNDTDRLCLPCITLSTVPGL
jgi:hypothetical protein